MRYFNNFGERQSKEYAGVVNVFLERIQNKLPPKINGDGLQARDFVFVGDVVRANIMAMESNIDHAFFNVGTNTSTSVLELANIMIKAANLDIKPIFGPPLEGDIKMSIADISFIEKSLDWHPTISIQNWLEQKISAQNN
jgi:UDP-glucose 4-epimerase